MAKIPESAYRTEASATKQYDKEQGELKKLSPGKKGWLGSGRQDDNIKADGAKAQEYVKGKELDDKLKDVKKIPAYKRGGVVKKTGIALVHKGEKVVPKSARKKDRIKR